MSNHSRIFFKLFDLIMIFVFAFGSPLSALADPSPTGATITTQLPDYPPGSIVIMIGEGWAPQEAVHIVVNDSIGNTWMLESNPDPVADETGTFTFEFQLPDWFVALYTVSATGFTSGTATVTFTDVSIGTYDQCSNDDGDGYASGDTGCRWINGNLQRNNSVYTEGDATVQRAWLTRYLPGSEHTVTFTYGTTKGGKHAYDFLTTWDWSENWITLADLCQDITGCESAAETTGAIPADPNAVGFDIAAGDRYITMRGGTITAVTTPTIVSGSYTGDSETAITISFTVDDSGSMCAGDTCNVAIWFGAHVAVSGQWKLYNGTTGAGSISGSPYHVALSAVDSAAVGKRDNQMQAEVITYIPNGTIVLVKDAVPNDAQDFGFNLNNNSTIDFGTFYLDDDSDPTLSNTFSTDVPPGTWYAKELMPLPEGWSLTNLVCVDPTSNTTVDLATGTATINLASLETVTCTYTNTKAGHIIVKKVTSGGDYSFEFDPSWGDNFFLSNGQTKDSGPLPAGTYSVAEVNVPSTWSLTSATCDDGSPVTAIALSEGETVTCTFNNTRVYNQDLTVTKTAEEYFGRTYTWDIYKNVDKTTANIPDGSSATFNYTVGVTHDNGTDSGFIVSGAITVHNPNAFDIAGVDVTDAAPGGTCTVTGGTNLTVTAGGDATVNYSCSFASNPGSGTNTATATWNATTYNTPTGSASGTAGYDFAGVTPSITNASVTVTDTLGGDLGTVSYTDPSPTEFTYSHTFYGVGGTCTNYDNTATIHENGKFAKKVVEVCVGQDLIVTKTATASKDRLYKWLIDKSVDDTRIEIAEGGLATFNYSVKVTPNGYTDSGYALGGTITINNPNDWEDVTVDLADTLDKGGTCSITEAATYVVPKSGSLTLHYTCTTDGTTTKNTATVTWDKDTYATPTGSASNYADVTFAIGGETNKTITVIDDKTDPAKLVTLGTRNWADGEHTFTYSLDKQGVAGTCTDYTNTAVIDETDQSDSQTVTVCVGKDLTVTKTATASKDRLYKWLIDKSVDDTRIDIAEGGMATFNYSVKVTPNGYTESGYVLGGTITINNPNDWEDVTVDVADTLDKGGTCTIIESAPYIVQKSGLLTLHYTCTTDGTTSENTATVTWDKDTYFTPSGSASNYADVTFAIGGETNKTITVVDDMTDPDNPVTLGTWNWANGEHTFTYSLDKQGVAGTCTDYTNTAVIDETHQFDSQTVTVCVGKDLVVSKTAFPTFTRTWDWTITKDFDATYNLFAGGSVTHGYMVTVTPNSTDSAWKVVGTITIYNPNKWEAIEANLVDATNLGGTCVVDYSDVTVPANGSVNVGYACTWATKPDPSNGTNTATTTWDKDAYFTPNGTATGSQNFEFRNPNEINPVITVDDNNLNGESWSANRSYAEWTYSKQFACSTNPADYVNGVDTITHINTASINETTGDSDTATVTVNCYLPSISKTAGTTYTRQYDWTITKGPDGEYWKFISDPATSHGYTIAVDQTVDEYDFLVSGTITVVNPAPMALVNISLTDVLSTGQAATITGCTGGTWNTGYKLLTIPANTTATCNYTVDLGDGDKPANGTNTVTTSLVNKSAGVRYRSFGNTGASEIYLGVGDLGVGGNRVEQQFTWGRPGTYDITFTYDPNNVNGELTQTISQNGVVLKTLTYNYNGIVPFMGGFEIIVNDSDAVSQVNFTNVKLDGNLVGSGDFIGNNAFAVYKFADATLNDGFTFTGTIYEEGTFSNCQECSRVEILTLNNVELSATADYAFGDPTTVVGQPTIHVTDDYGTPAVTTDDKSFGPFSADGIATYSRNFSCPTDQSLYTNGVYEFTPLVNTASINEITGKSDTATVTVHCYLPLISKTANGTYDEVHDWEVFKTGAAAQKKFAGQSASFSWTVRVDETTHGESYLVYGDIVVTNPNPKDALTITLNDVLDDGSVATIGPCTFVPTPPDGTLVGNVLTVPAGATATCDYSVTPKGDLNDFANALPAQVTMKVDYPESGDPAYFEAVTITGDGALNGVYEGWCIDQDHTIAQNTNYTADVFSSYEALPAGLVEHPENFDLVNWILNQDYVYKPAGGSLGNYTYGDVQRAIWELIDDAPYSTSSISPWNQTRVNQIKAAAITNGEGFTPSCGDFIAVILVPYNAQHVLQQSITIAQVTFASLGVDCATENAVTAVLNGIEFSASAEILWTANPVNATASLDDTQNPDWPITVSGDQTFTYTDPQGYTCPSDPAAYAGDGIAPVYTDSNTATLTFDTGSKSSTASISVTCYGPIVSKTATAEWRKKYEWTITKTADPTSHTGFAGDTFTSSYDVFVDQTITDYGYLASGTISIKNPSGSPGNMTVNVADMVSGGFAATVDCDLVAPGNQTSVVVAPNATRTCNYSASLPDATSRVNTATGTFNNIAFPATANVTFGAPIIEGYPTINVTDSVQGALGSASEDKHFTYTDNFSCSTNPADYTNYTDSDTYGNIATITETGSSDDASVTVSCYIPEISKTAAGTYDERHEWNVEKTVSPVSQSAFAGDTVSYEWTVTVDEDVFDENFVASGTITIINHNAEDAMTVVLSDVLSDTTAATITACTGDADLSDGLTIAAGGTSICDYTAALSYNDVDNAPTNNTATAVLNGISYSASDPIEWVANVIRGSATLDDDQNPNLPPTITDGGTWKYPETYQCSTDKALYEGDNTYSFSESNTATLTSGDFTDSSTVSTSVACYIPTISKDANGTYNEVHDWEIFKTVNTASQTAFAGEKKNFTWTVRVDETTHGENYLVTGVITVVNPNPEDALTVALSDALNDGSVATIGPCTGGTWSAPNLTVPAGGTATCEYSVVPQGDMDVFNAALPETVTINSVNPGPESYWLTTVSNDAALNGVYDAWCIDIDHTMNPGQNYTATVYSSYEAYPAGLIEKSYNMDLVNWIINQNYVGTYAGSGLGNFTYGDVQRAIWELIEDNPTDTTAGLGSFNQTRVNLIKAAANAYGEGFVPTCGDFVAVLLVPTGGQQPIAIAQVTFASLGINCAESNAVTAVLNGIEFPVSADILWTVNKINETASLDDDQKLDWPTTVSADTTFTYQDPQGYTCSTDPTAYTNGYYQYNESNTAVLTYSPGSDTATAYTVVKCYAPVVTKTAAGAYDERHEWDVEKSVDPTRQNAFAGDTVSYEWTVTVTESVFEENFVASGTISVKNPRPDNGNMVVKLTDVLSDGFTPTITGCLGGTWNATNNTVAVPPNTTAVCSYTASLIYSDDANAPTNNTVTAELMVGTTHLVTTASDAVEWAVNVIRDSATLDDDQNPDLPDTITDGGTWTYAESYTCSTDKSAYGTTSFWYKFYEDNTAIVTSGNERDRDTASTEVNCYWPQIEITKTGDELSKITDKVFYDITVFNNTPTDLGLRALSCTISDPKIGFSKIVELASGASDENLDIEFTIPQTNDDPFFNTASVTCSPLNSAFSVSDSAEWSTNLFQPAVEIIKTGPLYATSGDVITYTFTINNLSSSDSLNLILDTLVDDKIGDLKAAAVAAGCDNLVYNGTCTFAATKIMPDVGLQPIKYTNIVEVHYHPAGFPNDITDTDDHTVTLVPKSQLTDTSFCPLPNNQFRLLYRLEVAPNIYKLQASNPGQWYFNGFYYGEPGSDFIMNIQIPYPFVTQEGAGVPIQVHDGTSLTSAGCYLPNPSLSGFTILTQAMTPTSSAGNQIITSEDYTTKQLGQYTTVIVSGVVPETGFAYVTIHLDYALKKTSGWKNPGTSTLNPVTNTSILDMQNLKGFGNGSLTIHGYEEYDFARTVGDDISTTTPSSYNEIKKFAGFLGIVTDTNSEEPLEGVTIKIYSPTNALLATLSTDEDGYYIFEYKHKAKSATYRVEANYGQWKKSVSVTVKANGFAGIDFEVP